MAPGSANPAWEICIATINLMASSLVQAVVTASGVVSAPVDVVWDVLSRFTCVGDYLLPTGGHRCVSQHMVSLNVRILEVHHLSASRL